MNDEIKKNNTKNHPSQPNNQIFEDEIEKKTQLKRDKKKPESTGLTHDPSHKIVITPYKANKKKLWNQILHQPNIERLNWKN